MELRDYQKDLVSRIYACWNLGKRSVMAQLSTGGGKTQIFSAIARDFLSKGEEVLVVAHRLELITQAKNKLEAIAGIPCGVIKAGFPVEDHLSVQVASIQSLARRKRYPSAGLVIIDECFPAGTLIDGNPIESIKIGDLVTSFNEFTGEIGKKKVLQVFKNPAPKKLVKIKSGNHEIICTLTHPILTRDGWKLAKDITTFDELGVQKDVKNLSLDMHKLFTGLSSEQGYSRQHEKERKSVLLSCLHEELPRKSENGKTKTGDGLHYMPIPFCYVEKSPKSEVSQNRKNFLLYRMWQDVFCKRKQNNNGRNKQEIRICQNEVKQPYEQSRNQREGFADVKNFWAQAKDKRGKWHRDVCKSKNSFVCIRIIKNKEDVEDRTQCSYQNDSQGRVSSSLQNRHSLPVIEISNRSRWEQPQNDYQTSSRSKETSIIVWARVDSAEIYESSSSAESQLLCDNGYVYNLEVEGWNTYIANGIAVHNCHHSCSKSYTDLLGKYPEAKILGVTATPCRTDGQGFKHLFDDLVSGISGRELIEQGYLSKFKLFASSAKISTKGIRKTGGDYNIGQLEEASRKVTGEVVPTWRKHAEGKRTIIFCVSVSHSKSVVAEFVKAGIAAEHLDGETPEDDRAAAIERFKAGETVVLSNCSLFTEGFDVPNIEAIQILRPTVSLILHLQMLGRALRPSPGKEHAIIIEHTDNWKKHGLPDEDKEWSLNPISLKPGLFVLECPKCSHGFRPLPHEQKPFRNIVDAAGKVKPIHRSTCPSCLEVFEWEMGEGEVEIGGGITLEKEQGEIEEVDLTLTPEHQKIIDSIAAIAKEKGFKPRWIYYQVIQEHPDKVANFTYGDIRYLAAQAAMKFDHAKGCLVEAKELSNQLTEPAGSLTEDFVAAVDSLCAIALDRGYKLSWVYYRMQEEHESLCSNASLADWVYLAEKLQYSKGWAYKQKIQANQKAA